MDTENLLTATQMMNKLQIGKTLFREVWRRFPHIWVGKKKNDLRSYRFRWSDEVLDILTEKESGSMNYMLNKNSNICNLDMKNRVSSVKKVDASKCGVSNLNNKDKIRQYEIQEQARKFGLI